MQDTIDGLEGKMKDLAGDLSGAIDVVADLSRAFTFDFKGIGERFGFFKSVGADAECTASKFYLAILMFSWWKYGLTQTIVGTLALLYCRRKLSEQGNLVEFTNQLLPVLFIAVGCALAYVCYCWHLRRLAR